MWVSSPPGLLHSKLSTGLQICNQCRLGTDPLEVINRQFDLSQKSKQFVGEGEGDLWDYYLCELSPIQND